MTALSEQATAFLELHRPGDPVILPTVWDAWSADLVQQAGFPALTVGSHPLASSVGKPDQEGMAFTEVLARVREITAAVDVPVSVDLESGYGVEPKALVEGLLEAGGVGFNIEDVVHAEGGRMRAPQEHADLVGRLRQAADESGVHVVVNARTDLLRGPFGEPADLAGEAIERLRLAAAAGADVLYPVGRYAPEILRRLCAELPLPVNAIGLPEEANRPALAEAGVARVSFGPFLQFALGAEATRLLRAWR